MNCLVEHRQKIKDPKCRTFINKMAAVVFSDYRLIKGFYDSCVDDVRKLNCGQLSQPEDKVKLFLCFVQKSSGPIIFKNLL